MTTVRGPRGYDADAIARETGIEFDPDEDMTQQQFKDDADINIIVERAGITGEIPRWGNEEGAIYGDFSDVTDFQTGMQRLKEAESHFMQLPARIREIFDHNGMAFADWISDPANMEEAQNMGLIQRQSDDQTIENPSIPVEDSETLEDTPDT